MAPHSRCALWLFIVTGLTLWIDLIDANGDVELAFDRASRLHYPVDDESAAHFPFSAVGSFDNGCTGSLVGPCHVLTAGHCVLDPAEFRFSHGMQFRVIPKGPTQFQYTFDPRAIKVAQRWSTLSDPTHDVGLVQIHDPRKIIEEKLGYFSIGNSNPHDQSMTLNIAGYPSVSDSQLLWYDVCENVEFDFEQRRFVDHRCQVSSGSSGSPMWFYSRGSAFRELRALHTSALQFSSPLENSRSSQPQAIILVGRLLGEIQGWIDELPCQG